jgi:hypothetical protein
MTSAEWPELGRDRLDAAMPAGRAGRSWMPRRHPALGLRATATPTLIYLLAGIALGPYGLNILTAAVVGELNALSWVTLAVVGVLMGLGLADRRKDVTWRSATSNALIASITIAVVGVGLSVLIHETAARVTGVLPLALTVLGLCASVSAALPGGPEAGGEIDRASHLADYDDLPLLVIGTLVITVLAGPMVGARLATSLVGAVAIGVAGWLLFERATPSERGLFVAGTVLLLAGVGAFLGTSPLLTGSAAALVWRRAPGTADRLTARDLRVLQHPLVALLLVTAGAMVEWNAVIVWAAACLVVLRVAARLLASLIVSPVAEVRPALLATVLMPPGIMGVALALNVALVAGPDYRWILSAVTGATITVEAMAALLPSPFDEAR